MKKKPKMGARLAYSDGSGVHDITFDDRMILTFDGDPEIANDDPLSEADALVAKIVIAALNKNAKRIRAAKKNADREGKRK